MSVCVYAKFWLGWFKRYHNLLVGLLIGGEEGLDKSGPQWKFVYHLVLVGFY